MFGGYRRKKFETADEVSGLQTVGAGLLNCSYGVLFMGKVR